MSRRLVSVVPVALLCLAALASVTPAHAQDTYIQTDTTLDNSNPVMNSAYVGKDSAFNINTSPTVKLVTGGSIGQDLNSYNSSVVNVSGGSIGGGLNSYNSSVVNVSGGSIGGGLFALNSSAVTLSGGSIGQYFGINLFVYDNASLTLIGNNLTLTDKGKDPNFLHTEDFALSGTLADGTDLSGYVLNEINFSSGVKLIAATPEPSTLAFLLTGGIGAGLAFRRKHRK